MNPFELLEPHTYSYLHSDPYQEFVVDSVVIQKKKKKIGWIESGKKREDEFWICGCVVETERVADK